MYPDSQQVSLQPLDTALKNSVSLALPLFHA